MEELDVSSFDRETLDVMPAAHVKRLARNAGHEVKTKEEAIEALLGSKPSEPIVEPETKALITSIVVEFENGDEITYRLSHEILNKIHQVVVDEALKLL
jgi:hypothetical protein